MELYPVSADILYDGMMVDYGIYYYHKGTPVLLCKDVVLTSGMIRSIRAAMNFSDNVYMDKASRDRVLRETAYFEMAQMKVEKTVGYDSMKDAARDIIGDASANGTLPGEAVNAVAEDIGRKLESVDGALIMQCLNGIRGVDEYLYIHSLNVGFLNGLMAKWCGFGQEAAGKMVRAGLVHDLGKLKVSPEILNKPARLTALEFEAVKRHPEFGYDMLRKSGEKDADVLDAVLHHHERINAMGYPHRLNSEQISRIARITAISDVYDAMVAERPYKGASSPFVILQELSDTSFSDLDMKYVKILLENLPGELLGRSVLLSSGAVGKVEYIDARRPKYPIVSIDGERVKTNEDLCCVRMYAG